MDDLKIKFVGPIKFICNNQASLSIAKNLVHHDQIKHIEIDRHFISAKIESKVIEMEYIPTRHQAADILTKSPHRASFSELCNKPNLLNIYHQDLGEVLQFSSSSQLVSSSVRLPN